MKKTFFLLSLLAFLACSGCQTQQEEDGVSPLPQNRPSAKELRMGTGVPLKY